MNNVNKIALILSFVFPGFGQIWNREYIKGINLILLHIIFIILVFYPDSNLYPIGMVSIPILWIWGMVDASRIYQNYSSEYRRTQRRRNIRLTLGIIAFVILSEAIFVPTILTIRGNYKTTSEEDIYNESRFGEVSSDARNHSENRSEFTRSSNNISPNASSISESSNSDFEPKQKKLHSSVPANEDTFRSSEPISPLHPWVVTVSVSEKYDEISKLYHELSGKYQVQIIPISSNPKHNAFAVAIIGFATILDAENIANKLRKDVPKCFVASYENPATPVK